MVPWLKFLVAATLTAVVLAQQTYPHWKASYRLGFSYDPSSPSGPQNWPEVQISGSEWEDKYSGGDVYDVRIQGNQCSASNITDSSRTRPSPINLVPTEDCSDFSQIVTRPIRGGDCTVYDWDFIPTPFGLRAYLPKDDGVCGRPQLRLPDSRFPDPWDLRYMEVHIRSEHVLDGRRFDAELQMYHFGQGDNNDAVVAISVVVDSRGRRDHVEFEWMIHQWENTMKIMAETCERKTVNRISGGDQNSGRRHLLNGAETMGTQTVVVDKWKLNPNFASGRKLQDDVDGESCEPNRDGTGCEPLGPRRLPFPYSLWPSIWYYKYHGSMTSPPCSDVIHWHVLDEPLRISKRQFRRLVELTNVYFDEDCKKDIATSLTGENSRPLQPRNEEAGRQEVQHCTSDHFRHTMYAPEDQ